MSAPLYWHFAYANALSQLRDANVRRIDFTKFSKFAIVTRHGLLRCRDTIGDLENENRVGPIILADADHIFYIERVRE